MNIKLEKPLAIFDLEATGLDVIHDRIVEIAILKVHPDGKQESFERRVNPEMPIPAESSDIHGIYDKDVAKESTLKELLPELEMFLENCDIAGYNSNKFDLPMLAEEMLRVESSIDLSKARHIDVQNIFHKMEPRTLIAAYLFYCQKDLKNAHSAMADTQATWEVLDAQIGKYKELESDVNFLSAFSVYGDVKRADFAGRLAYNDKDQMIYNFGKHKNRTIEEVAKTEPGYYGWMIDADFPLYTKQCLRMEMDRIKTTRQEEKSQNEEKNYQNKLDALKNKFK